MVILVQPFEESNKTYMIDVGFGSTGPVRPILLSSAEDNVVLGATPAEKHRLTRRAYPLSSLGMFVPPIIPCPQSHTYDFYDQRPLENHLQEPTRTYPGI